MLEDSKLEVDDGESFASHLPPSITADDEAELYELEEAVKNKELGDWIHVHLILKGERIPIQKETIRSENNSPIKTKELDVIDKYTLLNDWPNDLVLIEQNASETTKNNIHNAKYVLPFIEEEYLRFTVICNSDITEYIITFLTRQKYVDFLYISKNCTESVTVVELVDNLISRIQLVYNHPTWYGWIIPTWLVFLFTGL